MVGSDYLHAASHPDNVRETDYILDSWGKVES